jgi:lipopolysaccharide biosynthesis glycosyltransferase
MAHMVIPVVTAATEDYFPGVKSLAASFANAGPGFSLYCICYGDLAEQCRKLGVIPLDPVDWAPHYAASDVWKKAPVSSYSRLNVPRMFPDSERVIWVDCDSIILKPLKPLADMQFKEPVACVYRDGTNFRLTFQVTGIPSSMNDIRCTCNGLLVFNVPEWNRLGITEACAAAMQTDLVFRYVDQSLLSYVLRGGFHRLGNDWQCYANRQNAALDTARILVWAGGIPWRDDVPNRDIWARYAE